MQQSQEDGEGTWLRSVEEIQEAIQRAAEESDSLQSNTTFEKDMAQFSREAAATIELTTGQEDLKAYTTALLAVACALKAPVAYLEHAVKTSLIIYNEDTRDADANLKFDNVAKEEKRGILNLPLHPSHLDLVLGFLHEPQRRALFPPFLHYKEDDLTIKHYRVMAKAALDGGTPLHFAAAAASSDQVKWLLDNGADVQAKTLAGEIPIQLVPNCGAGWRRIFGKQTICRCSLSPCNSSDVRAMLAKRAMHFQGRGFWAWLVQCVLSLLCLLGLWGRYNTLSRPGVDRQIGKIVERQQEVSRQRAGHLLADFRSQLLNARGLLQKVKAGQCLSPRGLHFDLGEPGGDTALSGSYHGSPKKFDVDVFAKDCTPNDKPQKESNIVPSWKASQKPKPDGQVHELLRICFDAAIKLQDMTLAPVKITDSIVAEWRFCPEILLSSTNCQASGRRIFSAAEIQGCYADPEEQAETFLLLAEAVYLQYRTSECPMELTEKSQEIMRAAVGNGRAFLQRMKMNNMLNPPRFPGYTETIGGIVARTQHFSIRLTLALLANRPARVADVEAARRELERWRKLREEGFVAEAGLEDDLQVECLTSWWQNKVADADLISVLRGRSLQPEDALHEILQNSLITDSIGGTHLKRPVSNPIVSRLVASIDTAEESGASQYLLDQARAAAASSAAEVACAEQLHECSASHSHQGTPEALQLFEETIKQAKAFPRLEWQAEAAQEVLDRRKQRKQALQCLEADVQRAKQKLPTMSTISDKEQRAGYMAMMEERLALLNTAITTAKAAEVPVVQAKRVLAEMEGQLLAMEAGEQLEAALACKDKDLASLKAATQKAEAAASRAGSSIASGHIEGLAYLQPVLQEAKRLQEIECAEDALQKAVAAYNSLSDLTKLEAAILAARKVKDVSPDILRAASKQRILLDKAAKSKASLDASIKALAKSGRREDANALTACILGMQPDAGLLQEELEAAQEALGKFEALAASQARLDKAVKEGGSSAAVERALQEAAAAGVKDTASAQKLCKAMQTLEAAMQRVQDPAGHVEQLTEKIAAAEAAGVAPTLIQAARAVEKQAILAEVQCELEVALKPRAERNAAASSTALAEAVQKAEQALSLNTASHEEASGVVALSPTTSESEREAVVNLLGLVEAAKSRLAREAAEQERIEQARAEQLQERQERLKAEQVERARRLEQQRLQKENAERQKEAQALQIREALESQASQARQATDWQSHNEMEISTADAAQKFDLPVTCRQMRPQPAGKHLPYVEAQARPALQPSLPSPCDSRPLPASGVPLLALDEDHPSTSAWQAAGTDPVQSDSFSFPAPLPLITADSWYQHPAAFLPVDRAPLPMPRQVQEDVHLPAKQSKEAPIERHVLQPGGQLVFGHEGPGDSGWYGPSAFPSSYPTALPIGPARSRDNSPFQREAKPASPRRPGSQVAAGALAFGAPHVFAFSRNGPPPTPRPGLHPYLPELSPDQTISVPIPEHCSGMSSNTTPEPHYVSGPFTGGQQMRTLAATTEREESTVSFDALPTTLDEFFRPGRPVGGFHHRKPSGLS